MTTWRLLITLAILTSCLVLETARLIKKPWPPRLFDTQEMAFKYGSIGAEVNGYPYLIWRELPTIFRDRIPKGWQQFGFIVEDGQDVPVGISVRRVGIPRVGFNCATCHTTTVSAAGKTSLVLGAPAGQLDLQTYLQFLQQVSSDPALTADAVIRSAEAAGHPINVFEKLVLRHVVFPRLGQEIAGLTPGFAWMARRPPHGPGRTDAGNVWRARWGLEPEKDDSVGTVDFPSVWNQRARLAGGFHWDGNNTSLTERNYSAALAGGAAEWLLARRAIGKISDWLLDLQAPAFPGTIDATKAASGARIFEREGCAKCHDKAGGQLGQVTPLTALRTDPERKQLFSATMVEYFKKVGSGYSWRFSHYRTTDGYANMPLDGIWLRAPYLHNGSVPTLDALLTPEQERPQTFIRGCDVLDAVKVGFQCQQGFEFDTRLRGNSNSGHAYGTALSAEQKSELIEYLKTL